MDGDLTESAIAMPSAQRFSSNHDGTRHLSVSILNYAIEGNRIGTQSTQGLPLSGAGLHHPGTVVPEVGHVPLLSNHQKGCWQVIPRAEASMKSLASKACTSRAISFNMQAY
jgi:hypothetical protein